MRVEYILIPVAIVVLIAAKWLQRKLIDGELTLLKGSKWGLNANPVYCPKCGTVQPRVRQPANRRQMLWGGYTCKGCNTEMDKWGKQLEP